MQPCFLCNTRKETGVIKVEVWLFFTMQALKLKVQIVFLLCFSNLILEYFSQRIKINFISLREKCKLNLLKAGYRDTYTG